MIKFICYSRSLLIKHWIPASSILIGLIGIIWTAWAYFDSKPKSIIKLSRDRLWAYSQKGFLGSGNLGALGKESDVSFKLETPQEIEIRVNGIPVKFCGEEIFVISNIGDKAIRPDAFERPIELNYNESFTIVKATLVKSSIPADISLTSKSQIRIKPLLLNPGDKLAISVIGYMTESLTNSPPECVIRAEQVTVNPWNPDTFGEFISEKIIGSKDADSIAALSINILGAKRVIGFLLLFTVVYSTSLRMTKMDIFSQTKSNCIFNLILILASLTLAESATSIYNEFDLYLNTTIKYSKTPIYANWILLTISTIAISTIVYIFRKSGNQGNKMNASGSVSNNRH